MDSLLVIGIDTIAGWNLACKLSDRCDVLGLSTHGQLPLPGIATEQIAAHDTAAMTARIVDTAPRWIIYCGPLSAPSWDLAHSAEPYRHEPQTAAALAAASAACSARLTVISTDAVFAGPRMFHDEESPAISEHPAADCARAMERALAETSALVVRTHVYGWSTGGIEPGFAEKTWEALSAGTSPTLDGRRHATPLLATDLAEHLWRAYEFRLQGLCHLTGAERTSPFRFACELAAAFGLERPRTRPHLAELADAAGLADETSLNCRRACRALETPLPLLREGLQRFSEQQAQGWQRAAGQRRHVLAA